MSVEAFGAFRVVVASWARDLEDQSDVLYRVRSTKYPVTGTSAGSLAN